MDYEWTKTDEAVTTATLDHRESGEVAYRASRNDLLFGSNSPLRAVVEVYAGSDGHERFVRDVVVRPGWLTSPDVSDPQWADLRLMMRSEWPT